MREHWYVVLLCMALTAGGAYLYSSSQNERYESSATLLIAQDEFESSVAGLDRNAAIDPERQSATDLALVEQDALAQRVIERAGVDKTPEDLLEDTTAETDGGSRIVKITVTDTDPARAARLATFYASEYVAFRAATERARYRGALRDIQSRLDLADSSEAGRRTVNQLRQQRDQVALLASLENGGATVLQAGLTPKDEVSPRPLRAAVIGLLFGALIGWLLAAVRDRMDSRLREERDILAVFPDVPVIAAIPGAPSHVANRALDAESFRGLQTTLSVLDADKSMSTVLVTSATVSEGKTVTSLNLALAMAERDETVLLLEADLRRRGLSERLNVQHHAGLSDVLAGTGDVADHLIDLSLDRSLVRARAARGSVVAREPGVVQMLPAGSAPDNPHALLTAERLGRALDEARTLADKVVVDGTPLGLVKDMLPIASQVDAIVIVTRLRHTRRRELERLRDLLASARVQAFGLVIFGIEEDAAYKQYLRRG